MNQPTDAPSDPAPPAKRTDTLNIPALSGARYTLRPITPEYHRPLYAVSIGHAVNFRWRFHGAIPPFEVFERGLYTNVLVQFAVVLTRSPQSVIGQVVAYDSHLQDGIAFLGVVSDPRAGAGILEAVMLFVRYLFAHFPLRKVYIEAPEFNLPQFASAITDGILVEEGRLRGHHYFDNQYWDHVTYALYRDTARTMRDRFQHAFPAVALSDVDTLSDPALSVPDSRSAEAP